MINPQRIILQFCISLQLFKDFQHLSAHRFGLSITAPIALFFRPQQAAVFRQSIDKLSSYCQLVNIVEHLAAKEPDISFTCWQRPKAAERRVNIDLYSPGSQKHSKVLLALQITHCLQVCNVKLKGENMQLWCSQLVSTALNQPKYQLLQVQVKVVIPRQENILLQVKVLHQKIYAQVQKYQQYNIL